jgi:hypothetical protein
MLLLHCMNPQLALFCRANRTEQCQPSGVDRTTYAHLIMDIVTQFAVTQARMAGHGDSHSPALPSYSLSP